MKSKLRKMVDSFKVFCVLCVSVQTSYVGAVLPYLRHYSYRQPTNPLVYSHTRPNPWLPSYPTQEFNTEPPTDTVLFNRVPLDSSLPRLDSSMPSVLTAIDPGTYYADWHRLLNGHTSQRCYPIPKNMTLCQDVGYDHMILPNYLQHEDLKEATAQSQVWISLAHTECHPDLKRFLCAVYAPVCLQEYQEKLIEPCKDLCEDVRQSCLPKMLQFGFGWPDIVNCARFPVSSTRMCVPLTEKKRSRCSGCVEQPTFESVVSSYCMADVALKARITLLTRSNSSTGSMHTLRLRSNPRILKLNTSLPSLSHLLFEVGCECNLLDVPSGGELARPSRWLIMGKLGNDGRTLQVEHLSRIRRKSQGLKRAIRAIRRSSPTLCRLTLPNANKYNTIGPGLNTQTTASPQRNSNIERGDFLPNTAVKKSPRLYRREQMSTRFQQYRHMKPTSTSAEHIRRNRRKNRRRSLVRRSQTYPNRPIASPLTISGHNSPSNRYWNPKPTKLYHIPTEKTPLIGARRFQVSQNQYYATKYPLLESEKDLFSPQNLVPWLH